jgi:glycosyltransferase involved in cell wall biosynthesis
MARAFVALLHALGHEVEIASSLRSYDREGDPERQMAIRAAAEMEAARLIADWRSQAKPAPDLWFTYHSYHKAPDWLGPAVVNELRMPYVVAEASVAGKQANGAWALGHRATIEGINSAAKVLAMTRVDAVDLAKWLSEKRNLVLFPPFLAQRLKPSAEPTAARRGLSSALGLAMAPVWLVTVAMMRRDIKTESYRLLARALAAMGRENWRLLVIGDGENAAEVRAHLTSAAGDRVRFLGQLDSEALATTLCAADVFVWPALREAYGMAILEALSLGLPVVACDGGGVSDLVEHEGNGLLAKERSATGLATCLDRLVDDPALRAGLAARAQAGFEERHSPGAAAARMASILASVAGAEGRSPCA